MASSETAAPAGLAGAKYPAPAQPGPAEGYPAGAQENSAEGYPQGDQADAQQAQAYAAEQQQEQAHAAEGLHAQAYSAEGGGAEGYTHEQYAEFAAQGYGAAGYAAEGYEQQGYAAGGYTEGYSSEAYGTQAYAGTGYADPGYADGYAAQTYAAGTYASGEGYPAGTYSTEGHSADAYAHGYHAEGYGADGYSAQGYLVEEYGTEGYATGQPQPAEAYATEGHSSVDQGVPQAGRDAALPEHVPEAASLEPASAPSAPAEGLPASAGHAQKGYGVQYQGAEYSQDAYSASAYGGALAQDYPHQGYGPPGQYAEGVVAEQPYAGWEQQAPEVPLAEALTVEGYAEGGYIAGAEGQEVSVVSPSTEACSVALVPAPEYHAEAYLLEGNSLGAPVAEGYTADGSSGAVLPAADTSLQGAAIEEHLRTCIEDLVSFCRNPAVAEALAEKFESSASVLRVEDALAEAQEQLQVLQADANAKAQELAEAASGARESARLASSSLAALEARCTELDASAALHGSKVADVAQELGSVAQEAAWVELLQQHVQASLSIEAALGKAEDAASEALRLASTSIPNAQVAAALSAASSAVRSVAQQAEAMALQHPAWARLLSSVDVRLERLLAKLTPAILSAFRLTLGGLGLGEPGSAAPPAQEGQAAKGRAAAQPLSLADLAKAVPQCLVKAKTNATTKQQLNKLLTAAVVLQTEKWGMEAARAVRQGLQQQGKQHESSSTLDSSIGRAQEGVTQDVLWPLELLLQPVASSAQRHTAGWEQKPELVFALAVRIARASVDAVEDLVQPVLDKAGLDHISAREEWVRAVVAAIPAPFLRRSFLPAVSSQLEARLASKAGLGESPACALWLHCVDQALSFDRVMAALVTSTAAADRLPSAPEPSSALASAAAAPWAVGGIFAEEEGWLGAWLATEQEDLSRKTEALLFDVDKWVQPAQGAGQTVAHVQQLMESSLLVSGEGPLAAPGSGLDLGGLGDEPEFVPPVGAVLLLRCLRESIARFKGVAAGPHRVRLGAGVLLPALQRVRRALEARRLEAQAVSGMVAASDLQAVCWRLNAIRYLAYELRDWMDNDFWQTGGGAAQQGSGAREAHEEGAREEGGAGEATAEVEALAEEVGVLQSTVQEWVKCLVDSTLRTFAGSTAEYVNSRRRWSNEEETEEEGGGADAGPPEEEPAAWGAERARAGQDAAVSRALHGPLDKVQCQLGFLKSILDVELYSLFWRQLAARLDTFMLERIVFGGARFSVPGALHLSADVAALCSVFQLATERPSAFFKLSLNAAHLLGISKVEARGLLASLSAAASSSDLVNVVLYEKRRVLAQHGVLALSPAQAELVLQSRVA